MIYAIVAKWAYLSNHNNNHLLLNVQILIPLANGIKHTEGIVLTHFFIYLH